jgi:putative NADPH-quinone reductase
MRILLAVDHPRQTSLTHAVAEAFRTGLVEAGHETALLDLYGEGFDPRMSPADEPDWSDMAKTYSAEVEAHMDRIRAADAMAFVFPVWWWGLPAMTKGYIDRVFNQGFAYGGSTKVPLKRIEWLALAATGEESYLKRGYLAALKAQALVGIANYCGVEDTRLELFYESLGGGDTATRFFQRAGALGRAW